MKIITIDAFKNEGWFLEGRSVSHAEAMQASEKVLGYIADLYAEKEKEMGDEAATNYMFGILMVAIAETPMAIAGGLSYCIREIARNKKNEQ